MPFFKDAQNVMEPNRRLSRREDQGRLQGGGDLEEGVGTDAGLDMGGANGSVWLRCRRKGIGVCRRPLILRKSGLKIWGRRSIKSQALDAMLRSSHFASQGTGTIGKFHFYSFQR